MKCNVCFIKTDTHLLLYRVANVYPITNTGNALARVQRMHKPVRLWDILHPQISRLLVLLKPADFEAQSSFL